MIKLGMILTCFILLASLLSTSIRYQKMLAATIANQETIVKNIFRMRIATKEAENTVVNFQRLLPTAYGTRSPDWLLYTRLDALKSRLQAT
ncbi:MAG: hypothetical protein J0653_02250, partial [Deltaproteobacteria bacterium]|nr:hypothetical protein [Deltaproteobacteria bacterium]